MKPCSNHKLLCGLTISTLLVLAGFTSSFVFLTDPAAPFSIGSTSSAADKASSLDPRFGEYWYKGEAEISSYHLRQARYGEEHEGDAVLIFVTEPFSRRKQVKVDQPAGGEGEVVNVLKLNATKKFYTGIYPYSVMVSSFSPVEAPNRPLKITATIQEWCGQVFTQINWRKNEYALESFSYFESEGDQKTKLEDVWLEDALWNQIRIAPENLPQGDFRIISGTVTARLLHFALKPEAAKGTLQTDSDSSQVYSLEYAQSQHRLKIRFEKTFPYRILAWEESYPGRDGQVQITRATLRAQLKTAYWQKNRSQDAALRQQLGLRE
ncbi:MAG: hypothetical protein HC913_12765 [Microscillaceae bacterium]|nr:hypothetical protein [Microscillaceae bacterium]